MSMRSLNQGFAGRFVSALVTLETLDTFEQHLAVCLDQYHYHRTQVDRVLKRNRELMQGGMSHAEALTTALDEVGSPAKKGLHVCPTVGTTPR